MRRPSLVVCVILLVSLCSAVARATVFATIHGVVHDAQHHPIANAHVALQAAESAFKLQAVTSSSGEFEISRVPIGVYRLEVSAPGFAASVQTITVASST